MGNILIHAGMPKTGSSSLQAWLGRHHDALRDRQGLALVHDRGAINCDTPAFVPYTSGTFAVSTHFILAFRGALQGGSDPDRIENLCRAHTAALADAADAHGSIIITSESLSWLLGDGQRPYFRALEELASAHQVRFVYYVSPPGDALESRWRQWGYHTTDDIEGWLRDEIRHLRYHAQLVEARRHAPSVSFEPRPFHRDALLDGDVVTDFADMLGVRDLADATLDLNPGLSLDLSLLLQGAPRFVTKPDHLRAGGVQIGRRGLTLAAVTADWELEPSARALRVRSGFRAVAHAELGDDAAALLDLMGWDIAPFTRRPDTPMDIDTLAGLLERGPDTAADTHLHRALADLCAAREDGANR